MLSVINVSVHAHLLVPIYCAFQAQKKMQRNWIFRA